MQHPALRYVLQLGVLSLVLWLMQVQVLQKIVPPSFYFENTGWINLFFTLFTLVFHHTLLASRSRGDRYFVRWFMAATLIKFFIFLTVIFFYAFTHRQQAKAFILAFFAVYLVYLVFEVMVLYRQFSREKKSSA